MSRAISSFRIWFSTRSAWFSLRRASIETVSVESASRGDIQSVNHKTAPPRKPLSPEICPGYGLSPPRRLLLTQSHLTARPALLKLLELLELG